MYLNRSTPTSDLISVNFLLNFHGMSRGQEKHPDDIVRKQQGVGYAEQSPGENQIHYIHFQNQNVISVSSQTGISCS